MSQPRADDGMPCVPHAECSCAAAPVVHGLLLGCVWRCCTDSDGIVFAVGCNNWLASGVEDRMGRCAQNLVVEELVQRPDSLADPVAHVTRRILEWVPAAGAVASSEEGVAFFVSMLVRRALDVAAFMSMAPLAEVVASDDNAEPRFAALHTYIQLVAFKGETRAANLFLHVCRACGAAWVAGSSADDRTFA